MDENIRKELIRVTIDCNANCCFCNFCRENEKAFKNPGKEMLKKEIENLAKRGVRHIVFSGGEPLIFSGLAELISFARDLGVNEIELQTNAIALGDAKIEELKNSGLTRLFISMHSHNNIINKKLFNSVYDTKTVIENIKKLNKKGFKIILNPVVNAITYKILPAYAEFIVQNFPWLESVSLSVMQPHGRGFLNKQFLPDYQEISPYIKIFRQKLQFNNIPVKNPYCGLPSCIAELYKYPEDNVEYAENKVSYQQDDNKVYLKACDDCNWKFYCRGVWKEYLDIFGAEQVNSWLKPIND